MNREEALLKYKEETEAYLKSGMEILETNFRSQI